MVATHAVGFDVYYTVPPGPGAAASWCTLRGMSRLPTASFDGAAASYDRDFTTSAVGRWLRERVWRELAAAFPAPARLLELGCGSGEDAVWLARQGHEVTAVDASSAMLAVACAKAAAAGVAERIRFLPLDLAEAAPELAPPGAPFAGALADFGVVNCVADRAALGRALAAWLAPGASLVVVVMNPLCAWELAWYGLQLRLPTALRRLRQGRAVAVPGGGAVRTWYPRPGRLARELAPCFVERGRRAVGVVVPPPYLDRLVAGRPRLLAALAAADEAVAGCTAWAGDHYLLRLERRPG